MKNAAESITIKGVRPKDQAWLQKHDQDLRDHKYWGKLILEYQGGKIIRYEERRTGKPA